MKKKGFTLIELLAVIIILGILMIIAIPSVTRYINDSRKNAYIDTAKEVVAGTRNIVNEGKLGMYDTNTTYYIPAACVSTENALSSPFGEFQDAYVIVGYTGEGYVYYWASVDSAHQGIEMKEYNKLTKSDVQPNMESIDTTLGIGSRTSVKILDEDSCQSFVEGNSSGGNVTYYNGKTKETVETGDLVTIGTENFYVVKHDGIDLILLSCYTLKVGNIYIEVKTPLMMVSVKYGKNIKTRPKSPNSSTERFSKHVKELAESLKKEERAILLILNTKPKDLNKGKPQPL